MKTIVNILGSYCFKEVKITHKKKSEMLFYYKEGSLDNLNVLLTYVEKLIADNRLLFD